MRILHLFSDWKWTGPAEPALLLATRLGRSGHEVFFACSSPPHAVEDSLTQRAAASPLNILDGLYLEKHFHFRHNLRDVRFLRNWIRRNDIDVVHCHRDQDHFIGGAAARLAGTNASVVRTNHTATAMSPLSVRHRLLLHRLTDHLIEVSKAALEWDRKSFSIPREKLSFIEAAVDIERFRPGAHRPPKESLGIDGEDVVVGIVARVQRHRRFEVLFEAFHLALKTRRDLRLLLVGRGTHYDEVAREPVERLGIGDRVALAGYRREDFAAILSSFDMKVFLVPGTDGSCRAVREAMASGIPVIAAQRGMLPEIVEEGAGLVIDDTPENLSKAILRLAEDPSLRDRLAAGARSAAEARFDPARHAYSVEKVYERVMKAPSRRFQGPDMSALPQWSTESATEEWVAVGGGKAGKGEEAADGLASVGEWPGLDLSEIVHPPSPGTTAPTKPVDVSVVVVNWNGVELLPECLDSIPPGSGRLNTEVIVVDNASTDGSVEYLRAHHPGVILVANPRNLGFGAANNLAFQLARGGKILLLNSDARLKPGTLATLSDFLDGRPDSGAVTPALVGADGKAQNAFDNLPTLSTELLNKHLFRLLFPDRFPGKKMKSSSPVEVESAIGACLLLRREALDKAGPFDESFFFFLEETDLCRRIRNGGYGIHFHPGVEAVHLGGASKAKARAEAWIEYYRSLYRYFQKNETPWVYRTLRAGRFVKLLFNTAGTWVVLQVSMGMHERSKRRFPVYLKLLSWHLRGCPEGEGLRRG